MIKRGSLFFALVLLCNLPSLSRATTLSLEAFLDEVHATHKGIRGARDKAAALGGRLDEGALQFAPTVFSQLHHTDDRSVATSPLLLGITSKTDVFTVGLSKQERFGLTSKVSISLQHISLRGLPPTLPSDDSFSSGVVGLEFSQPLWRNAWGRDLNLRVEELRLTTEAERAAARFQAGQILIMAEKSYWGLAAARELLKIHQASFERAKAITAWQERRVRQNLADEGDLLQARAALKLRELELSSTEHQVRRGLKRCNDLRGQAVEAELRASLPAYSDILTMKAPQAIRERGDQEARRLRLEAARKSVEIANHQFQPSLDVFANGALTGKDPQAGAATRDTVSTRHPQVSVGVRFSMPLDGHLIASTAQARLQELAANHLSLEQHAEDLDHEWQDLGLQLDEARRSLGLGGELEQAQKRKIKAEQTRFQQGRSTTMQMFLFEQDFLHAQVSRVQAAARVLDLMASMRGFAEGKR